MILVLFFSFINSILVRFFFSKCTSALSLHELPDHVLSELFHVVTLLLQVSLDDRKLRMFSFLCRQS